MPQEKINRITIKVCCQRLLDYGSPLKLTDISEVVTAGGSVPVSVPSLIVQAIAMGALELFHQPSTLLSYIWSELFITCGGKI